MTVKPFFLFITSAILLSLSSLLKFLSTSSLMVDANPVYDKSIMLLITGMFFISVTLSSYAYWKVVFRKPGFDLTLRQTKRLAQIVVVIVSLMLPLLSNDFSIYMAHGNLLGKGILTYADGTNLQYSDFYPYVSYHWKSCPNFYGPPLLLIFYFSTLLGGKSLLASWLVYKVFNTVVLFIYIRISEQYCESSAGGKYNTLGLLTLAPVFLIQSAGQAHVDTMILTLSLITLLLLRRNKIVPAAFVTGVLISCKVMHAAVFLPFFFIVIYFMHRNALKKFLGIAVGCCIIILSVVVISYRYFWEGSSTITVPVVYHFHKPPANSLTAVFADAAMSLPHPASEKKTMSSAQNENERKPKVLKRLQEGNNPDAETEKRRWHYRNLFGTCFAVAGFLLAVFNFIALAGAKKPEEVVYIFGKILVITVCFFSKIFHPWYLLLPLPFLADSGKKSWMVWLVIIPGVACLHEIKFIIPPTEALFSLAELLILPALGLFFLYFRQHFIREPLVLLRSAFKGQSGAS